MGDPPVPRVPPTSRAFRLLSADHEQCVADTDKGRFAIKSRADDWNEDMEDKSFDDFFNDLPEPETEQVIEAELEETSVSDVEPAIDADPEPQAIKDEPKAEPTTVPLAALHAERDKAREYREELDRLRQQIAQPQVEAASNILPSGVPDPYDDPIAYHQYQQQQLASQVQQAVFAHNLTASRARAVQKYGQEFINDVADWAGVEATRNPAFEAELMQHPDPAEWVVEQKKRSDLFKSFSADPDAFVRQRAVELGLAAGSQEHAAFTTPATNKPNGPRSLATARSTNEAVSLTQKAKDDFDAIFRK